MSEVEKKVPSVYLPSDEDTKVTINVPGAEPVELDIIELDELVDRAVLKARSNSSDWKDEFKDLLRLELKIKLSKNQAYWLYVANRERIEAIKKKLFSE